MDKSDIWDLFFFVGDEGHLAIVEGINRQPEDPLAYANILLEDSRLPPLTQQHFQAGVRRLIKAGVLESQGHGLRLTGLGREALDLNLHWPREGGRLLAPGEIEQRRR